MLRRSAGASRARLTVTPEIVEVVVPTSATDDQIKGVLHRRRRWLYDQTQSMAEQTAKAPMIGRFASGAKDSVSWQVDAPNSRAKRAVIC